MTKSQIGILGAGSMGSGIALAALYAGHEVVLMDVSAEVLEGAEAYIGKHLARKDLSERTEQLTAVGDVGAMTNCDVVIEAVVEDLELKRQLFGQLDHICPAPAVLATNTSTLSVTAIAGATSSPHRVAGMHFFNPAPVMKLVEVVKTSSTDETTIDTLVELAESMEKTAVVTGDSPGFIVNRVARPFYGEALRLYGERVAGFEDIDVLITLGAGFRMGPFELIDLIGLDVNLAAATSMYESTYGEPRYRPHWIQRQMVDGGTLGRKTGRGFYHYDGNEKVWSAPEIPPKAQHSGYVLVSDGSWGPGIGKLLGQVGYTMSETHGDVPLAAIVVNGREEGIKDVVRRYDRGLAPDIPILCQTVDIDLSEITTDTVHPERIVGFDGLFLSEAKAVALVAGDPLDDLIRQKASELIRSFSVLPVWVRESSGMVVSRVFCCLANEAAFALGEGVAEAVEIDSAMILGMSYPVGPFEWAQSIGYTKVVDTLDHMARVYGEERYRVAPWLRRQARQSTL